MTVWCNWEDNIRVDLHGINSPGVGYETVAVSYVQGVEVGM